MERGSVSTVKAWATTTASSIGTSAFRSWVSSSPNTTAVNGHRIVPPSTAAMLISAQNPAPSAGKTVASSPPSAPPIMSRGASTPPDVPDPRETRQKGVLHEQDPAEPRGVSPPVEDSADLLVADAERGGKDPPAEPDHHT